MNLHRGTDTDTFTLDVFNNLPGNLFAVAVCLFSDFQHDDKQLFLSGFAVPHKTVCHINVCVHHVMIARLDDELLGTACSRLIQNCPFFDGFGGCAA